MKAKIILFIIVSVLLSACNKTEKKYYPNGNLCEEISYKDNKKHGPYRAYYPNGNLQQESEYVNGKIEGITKWYYENGDIKFESNFKNDKENGKVIEYSENNTINTVSDVKDGKQHGLTTIYFKNGKVDREIYFTEGKQNGDFRQYNVDGSLSMYAIYDMDSVIYYEQYDSIGNFTEEYRLIKVTPEKEKYYVGEKYRAKIIISGPKNYKSSKIAVSVILPDKVSQLFENVSEVNFETANKFEKAGTHLLHVTVIVDKGTYSRDILFEVEGN